MKKVILFIIIGLIVLGLIGNVLYPETEEQKNTQVLNKHGLYITSKKTTQGDTCLVEILITSKDEDVLVQQFTIGTTDINDKNLTFSFVKTYLKKDIAQQELKRFPMTCEKIKIHGARYLPKK
jgi:exo-beta-1,3-glucanase (GH17 family)